MPIDNMNPHYSITNPSSVYDEEALTALELVGRVTAKMRECIRVYNELESEYREAMKNLVDDTDRTLDTFQRDTIPNVVNDLVIKHIKDGTFDEQISDNLHNLNERLDNLLGSVGEGSTVLDAEVIDTRTDASGRKHENAGTAVRKQVNDLRGAVSKRNLIDMSKVVRGYLDIYDTVIDTYGRTNTVAKNRKFEVTTDYIPVEPWKFYTFSVEKVLKYSGTWYRVVFYDVNKHKIADKSGDFAPATFQAPEDCYFMRISFHTAMLHRNKLEEGDYPTAIEAPKETGNVLDVCPLIFPCYLTATGEVGNQTEAGYVGGEPALLEMTSHFYPVTGGDVYNVHNDTEKHPWFAVSFYDGEGAFIERKTFTEDRKTLITFTVPDNAVAMRVSSRTYYLNNLIVAKDGDYMGEYVKLLVDSLNVKHTNRSKVKGIAHRGLSSVAPENTASAIRAAAEAGFKYVELDVRITSDDKQVIIHDETVDRTSNGTGNVADMTLEELKALDFGSWFNEKYSGEKILTLDEAMSLCMNLGLHPYIEMKVYNIYIPMLISQYAQKFGKDCCTLIGGYYDGFGYGAIMASQFGVRSGVVTGSTDIQGIIASIEGTMEGDESKYTGEIFLDIDCGVLANITDDLNAISMSYPIETWTVDNEETINNLPSYITGVTSNTLDASQVRYKNAMEVK